MKKYLPTILYLLVASMLFMGCGSSKQGAIKGHIASIGDKMPVADVQIILCKVQDDAYEHLICKLQIAPTTISDNAGNFELTDVPTGTYVLMYGLPGVLKMTPEEWDGIDVTRGTFCMKSGQNSVCEIEGVTPSAFWAEGSVEVGSAISAFKYLDNEQQPGVVILAGAEEGSAGEQFHIYQGTIISNHTGILANIMAGQYSPTIGVAGNKTVTVEIEIPIE